MKAATFNKVLPLALSGIVFSSNSNSDTFSYNDLEMGNLKILDDSIMNHLKGTSDINYHSELSRIEFYNYLEKWQNQVRFLSSPRAIVENSNFQRIVSKGKEFLPYIVEELKNRPSYLVWTLNYIFGYSITESRNVTIPEAAKLWIKHIGSHNKHEY